MTILLESLFPIILLMVGVFSTTVFVFLRSPSSTLTKFLLVPISLVAAATIPTAFVLLMGYSVSLPPPKSFTVVAHHVTVVNNKKTRIEIWVKEKETTRLYSMPYNKKVEEQLEQAEKGRAKGLEPRMKKRDGSTRQGTEQDDSPFHMELLSPADIHPKDGPPTEETPVPNLPEPKYTT